MAPSETHHKPILALTMGDVNGVGPELLARAMAEPAIHQVCLPVIVGDMRVYEEARKHVPDAPPAVHASVPFWPENGRGVALIETDVAPPPVRAGILDPEAGAAAVSWIKRATAISLAGDVDGMVTGPINKEGIHLAGFTYQGHTDLIAELSGSPEYRMCLFTDTMRIVHISAHCSLRQALDYVTTTRIAHSIRIGNEALDRLNLPRRRIAVAGLNPHGGESGAFGREEIDIIAPAVHEGQAGGIDCSGPYSPDTVFARMRDGEFDMVIAMYHDQGHIPLKLIAMDEGVNVTLGIPIVRTSPDHGTAYDIAWQGIARPDSLIAAIKHAASLAAVNPRERSESTS